MKAHASIWDEYARAQKRADRAMIDPNYWAADQTADNILSMIETGAVPISDDALRKMTRNWRKNLAATERRRKAIEVHRYGPELLDTASPSPEGLVLAREGLAGVRAKLTAEQFDLLEHSALGETDEEIGARCGLSARAVEGRLRRLRLKLAS